MFHPGVRPTPIRETTDPGWSTAMSYRPMGRIALGVALILRAVSTVHGAIRARADFGPATPSAR